MDKFFINRSSTFKEAISKLNESGSKTIIIVGKKNRLIGTLSDGDLRKAFLKNQNLDQSIKNIYQNNPFYLTKKNIALNNLKKIFLKHEYDLVPVVNNKMEVVKIFHRNCQTQSI